MHSLTWVLLCSFPSSFSLCSRLPLRLSFLPCFCYTSGLGAEVELEATCVLPDLTWVGKFQLGVQKAVAGGGRQAVWSSGSGTSPGSPQDTPETTQCHFGQTWHIRVKLLPRLPVCKCHAAPGSSEQQSWPCSQNMSKQEKQPQKAYCSRFFSLLCGDAGPQAWRVQEKIGVSDTRLPTCGSAAWGDRSVRVRVGRRVPLCAACGDRSVRVWHGETGLSL